MQTKKQGFDLGIHISMISMEAVLLRRTHWASLDLI